MMSGRDGKSIGSLMAIFDESRKIFHRLKWIAEHLHGDSGVSVGQRGVMQSLLQGGPQTVPQLARARPVTRQHIQALVNGLLEMGMVALEENPAHARSKLVVLTEDGERTMRGFIRREAELLARLETGLSEGEIEATAKAMRAISASLGSVQRRRILRALTSGGKE